jgi:hypothetical protein
MPRSGLPGADYDRWPHPSYEIRVRGTMYLWGSDGVTKNITFHKPLLLHIHNDPFGEVITFGTQVASKTQTMIGTLQPHITYGFVGSALASRG